MLAGHPQQRASSYFGPATPSACASNLGGGFCQFHEFTGTESLFPTVRLDCSLLKLRVLAGHQCCTHPSVGEACGCGLGALNQARPGP